VTSFCRKSAIYLFLSMSIHSGWILHPVAAAHQESLLKVCWIDERGGGRARSRAPRLDETLNSLRARDVGTKGRSKLRPGTGRGTHKFYETSKSKRAETFLFLDCRAETSIHDWISDNFREKDTRFLMAECVNVYLLGENLVCGAYQ
jgi:hypothetical protein